MRTSPECVPCFFRQIETASHLLNLSYRKRKKVFSVLTEKLLVFDFNDPPVVFGKTIYNTLSRISGTRDIFLKQKLEAEKYLLSRAGCIEKVIKRSRNPLFLSAKMATAANAIDFGTGRHPVIAKLIRRIQHGRLTVNHFAAFKKLVSSSRNILIIGDNCGEAIFDMFFIEQIRRCNHTLRIRYAVRSAPVINDIVMDDARRIGLQEKADVISSGCPYPGLFLSKISKRFREVYDDADIVISKGQGNFESLADASKDIFYLFKVKCPAAAEELRLPLSSLLFLHNQSFQDSNQKS